MNEFAGLLVVVGAIYLIARRAEVRLVLLAAAALLGCLGGEPAAILQTFFVTFTSEKFILPICTAMGFAQVLKATGCDLHLIHLLTGPLRRVRWAVLPGAVCVGFIVNIPIISQTSSALAVGAVLVPLLLSTGLKPVQVGAALLLGCSVGGELLNPGAPEINTVATALKVAPAEVVASLFPLLMVSSSVAIVCFWYFNRRGSGSPHAESPPKTAHEADQPGVPPPLERISILKAAVPLVPLGLLFLTGPPLNLVAVPKGWLINEAVAQEARLFDARLIGMAMLIGCLCAAATDRRTVGKTATAFFEGAGYAFTHIISLIVVAQCFGKGIELSGLAAYLGQWAEQHPAILIPMAVLIPLAFAALSGSGMAATQSLYGFFVVPAQTLGINPIQVGALVSIGAAAGRTMSPVAAVNLMSAKLTGTEPLQLSRAVAPPLLLGMLALILAAQFFFLLPNSE